MKIPDIPLGPSEDFPDRPDHPDFAKLSELVLQLDYQARDAGGVEDVLLSAGVDGESLAYVAFQRALRGMSRPGATVLRASALYLEGFVMGYRYHQRYGKGSSGNQD